MVNEASDELEAIGWDDRLKPEVLAVRVDPWPGREEVEQGDGMRVIEGLGSCQFDWMVEDT